MYYVQYKVRNEVNSDRLSDLLGSDGVLPLDGRLSLQHMIEIANSIKTVKNNNLSLKIVSFEIVQSERYSNDGSIRYTSNPEKYTS